MEPDYEAMTMAQLEAEFVSLAQQLVPIQNRRSRVADLIERRKLDAAARARLGAMPQSEREALRAVLNEDSSP